MDTTVEELKKTHYNNYKNAILEIIKNNTTILVDEDIMSLLKKPPLESMDVVKNKFLDTAKKNKIILNIEQINNITDKYRKDSFKLCDEIKKCRLDSLIQLISLCKDYDIIKLNKKDFNSINKKIRQIVKENFKKYLDKDIYINVDNIFSENIDPLTKEKFICSIKKYLNGNYQKQILENIDFKILVKDSILISGIKEQSERYLFTLNNSHMFDIV